mmetsp:Transcript_29237/g.72965  ORF Transcript_29237/g.72965 Transcript_29237/m.72965 type:complete len:386 (-) Transcript_29237:84-1241(-)
MTVQAWTSCKKSLRPMAIAEQCFRGARSLDADDNLPLGMTAAQQVEGGDPALRSEWKRPTRVNHRLQLAALRELDHLTHHATVEPAQVHDVLVRAEGRADLGPEHTAERREENGEQVKDARGANVPLVEHHGEPAPTAAEDAAPHVRAPPRGDAHRAVDDHVERRLVELREVVPVLTRVVDRPVDAERAEQRGVARGRREEAHVELGRPGELDRRGADAAAAAQDEQTVARLHRRGAQCAERVSRAVGECRALHAAHPCRLLDGERRINHRVLRQPAHAERAAPRGDHKVAGGERRDSVDDFSADVEAGDVREGGGVLESGGVAGEHPPVAGAEGASGGAEEHLSWRDGRLRQVGVEAQDGGGETEGGGGDARHEGGLVGRGRDL